MTEWRRSQSEARQAESEVSGKCREIEPWSVASGQAGASHRRESRKLAVGFRLELHAD